MANCVYLRFGWAMNAQGTAFAAVYKAARVLVQYVVGTKTLMYAHMGSHGIHCHMTVHSAACKHSNDPLEAVTGQYHVRQGGSTRQERAIPDKKGQQMQN